MPSYRTKITQRQAVDKAMAFAMANLGTGIDRERRVNCGDDDGYVWIDEESALNAAWTSKSFTHEVSSTRR